MSDQKTGLSRHKSFIIVLIVAVAITSVAFGYWISTFLPGRIEKIYFDSCYWEDDKCVLYIANTGADDLIINKVWINGTLLDSTAWECFPSMRFQPGDQGVLCINASLAIFQQGTTYRFTIKTLAGNLFSHTAKPQGSQFTWGGYESVEITQVTWTGPNTGLIIKVNNDGTKNLTIHHVEINYATTGLNVISPTLPYQLKTGNSVTIVMTYAYTNGTSYDISVVTSAGYEFTDHFTGGQDTSG